MTACKEVHRYEDDISAEKEIQIQGSRLPRQNEHGIRTQGPLCQKGKRKKGFVSLGRSYVASFSEKDNLWYFQNL